MDVCKCIVPLPHGGTLNCRRATSPLVRLVEGEERKIRSRVGRNQSTAKSVVVFAETNQLQCGYVSVACRKIDLLLWPARYPDRSPIENMWSMVAQRLTQIAPQLPHQINFGNVWKVLGLLYRKNTSKVSLNQCRGVWQW
ncbi:transposable element Tcb1 transposase [Trichonephila clavipes]|nr:transposable element Tcb1 transposase [Trichonephila clavipes]